MMTFLRLCTIAILSAGGLVCGSLATAADEWGSIEGQFVLEGEIPQLPPLVVKGNPAAKDAAVCAKDGVPDDSLIVNPENKGIANICLYLRKAPARIHPDLAKSAEKEITFDQMGCRFMPHVLIVRTDQTVMVKSGDPVNHNTHTNPFKNSGQNVTIQPNDRKGVPFVMKQSEIAGFVPTKVTCDIHPHMSAYWVVTDHPYVAVTDADGKFTIKDLPPGEHTFRVWHERPGYIKTSEFAKDVKVKVEPGKTTTLGPYRVKVEEFTKSK